MDTHHIQMTLAVAPINNLENNIILFLPFSSLYIFLYFYVNQHYIFLIFYSIMPINPIQLSSTDPNLIKINPF